MMPDVERQTTALIMEGRELRKQGNLSMALERFNRAVALDQDCAWAWREKGVIHYKRQEYSAALAAFRQEIRIHPLDDTAATWARDAESKLHNLPKSPQGRQHGCVYYTITMLSILAILGGLFCLGALIYYFFVPVGVPDPITHITMHSNDQKFSNMEPGLVFAIICLVFGFITFFTIRKR